MAPRSAKPDLARVEIRIPANLLKEALEMAEYMGLKPGDAHRDFWIAGVEVFAERLNKVLVNKSLRQKFALEVEEPYTEIEEENEE